MHIKFAEGPLLAHLHTTVALFWLTDGLVSAYDSKVNKLFNNTMQKVSTKLSKGALTASLKESNQWRPTGSPPVIITLVMCMEFFQV